MIKNYIYDLGQDKLYREEIFPIVSANFIIPILYDQIEFHEYHQKFVDQVYILGVKENERFIGYCYFGIRDNTFKAPYSSPFSLIYLKDRFKISDACLFIEGIKRFANEKGIEKINFTLSPEIYGDQVVNILSSTFFSKGFSVKSIELNNFFNLNNYKNLEIYLNKLSSKVRNKYKRVLKSDLIFEQLDINNFNEAYNVIKINREEMKYPLNISIEQMVNLINMKCLVARFFVIKKEEQPLAAAIVFDITENVSQVIYWGDIPEYRKERAMDLLALKIVDFYKKLGKKYLDIGPSSEDGIINLGLADFKQSIGCDTNIKISFECICNKFDV